MGRMWMWVCCVGVVLTLGACGDDELEPDAAVPDAEPDVAVDDGIVDMTPADGAAPDGASTDGAPADSAVPDGAPADAAPADSAVPDAASADAAAPDAGVECVPGTLRSFECPDGEQVPWCQCRGDGTWDCAADPAAQCPGPPLPPCATDADCRPDRWCDECAASSCPECDDCIAGCVPHRCPTEPEPACDAARPDCGRGAVAIVQDGCWQCVDRQTCDPLPVGECAAPIDCLARFWNVRCLGHWACDAGQCIETCDGEGCGDGVCDQAGGESRTSCRRDCGEVPECAPGETTTFACPDGEAVPWCRCEDGGWQCALEPEQACRDTRCDDGTEPLCDRIPPECRPGEILAHQADCYRCVNPLTCAPWGEAGCDPREPICPDGTVCDDCGTSSCPGCEDCVPACIEPRR